MTTIASRLWRPLLALMAIAYLMVMVISGALPERRQLVKFEVKGVMELAPEAITHVTITADDVTVAFARQDQGWVQDGDTVAIETDRNKTLERAIKFMHTATPVRILKPDEIANAGAGEFGLDDPRLSITLETMEDTVLVADFGRVASDGILRYMRLEGRDDLYLMSGFVGKEWESVANAATP